MLNFDKNYEGYAQGNQEMLEALHKALEAGSGVNAGLPFEGGRALTPESLDTTLVNVLWAQEEAKLFKALKKKPIKSPVHQWNKRTDVGDSDGAWVAEGGESEEKDQTITRQYVTAKYLQTLRKVTLQATITNMIEDAISIEKQAGTLWIIKQVEKMLFEGDHDVVAEEPDGLTKLITTNIIDLRGAAASHATFEAAMKDGCRMIRSHYGVPTDLYCSLMAMTDVQELLKDRIRFGTGTVLGSAIFTEYPTPFGKPKLIDDIFISEGSTPTTSTLTTKNPTIVTIAIIREAADGGRVSKFVTADEGDYYYQVVAVNKFGQAITSTAVQVTSVVAGDQVKITVTDGGTPGTGFMVFRSKKGAADGTDCRFMWKLKRTGASQVIYDLNADLPACSSGFLLNLNGMYDAVEWDQFLPLMKFDLYPTNAAVMPFLMLLFGVLGLKKEEQMVRIKNIAPSTLGWF